LRAQIGGLALAPLALSGLDFHPMRRPVPATSSKTAQQFASSVFHEFKGPQVRSCRKQSRFIHPFSSLPPLNAIKKIAHTPAARTRSTTKVCIFKPLCFRTTFWPANLWATRHDNPLGCFLLASSSIESRFEVAVAVDDKERGRQPKRPLHVCALELLELVPQFIKRLFCMLIQMAADLQFHFGNF